MSNLRNKYEVLNYLTEKNYTSIEPLGRGAYGDIFAAISPQQRNVALKVIPNEKSWKYEERVWSSLHHPNILPVIEKIDVKPLRCKIYVTPRHPSTLFQVIDTHEFKKEKNALRSMKKWFCGILSALDYLHSNNYCHLDVKTNNVLISMDGDAVLCDYTGLNKTGKHLRRLVAPMRYRSPECFKFGLTNKVEGVRFDMWSYGLLALNLMTDFHAMKKMRLFDRSWSSKECLNELTSCLKEVMQEMHFYDAFDKMFEHIWVSENDKIYALDFVRSLLKFDPKERLTAAQAMQHPFLREVLEDQEVYFGDLDEDSEEVLSEEQDVVNDALEKTNCEENYAGEEVETKEVCENLPWCVTDAKEQDSNISRRIALEISPDFEGENLSNDHIDSIYPLESKECSPRLGENAKIKNKSAKKKFSMRSTKTWFERKFNKLLKKKERHYERLTEDSD